MSEKNKWGRPLKFKSAEELQKKIDEYFESCFELDEKWKKVKIKAFTVVWLALYLWVDRVTLLNYEDKSDEFFSTIKRAKAKVEEDIENWILTNKYNSAAWIFNLKNNFWWKDKIETENNTTMNWEITIKLPEID